MAPGTGCAEPSAGFVGHTERKGDSSLCCSASLAPRLCIKLFPIPSVRKASSRELPGRLWLGCGDMSFLAPPTVWGDALTSRPGWGGIKFSSLVPNTAFFVLLQEPRSHYKPHCSFAGGLCLTFSWEAFEAACNGAGGRGLLSTCKPAMALDRSTPAPASASAGVVCSPVSLALSQASFPLSEQLPGLSCAPRWTKVPHLGGCSELLQNQIQGQHSSQRSAPPPGILGSDTLMALAAPSLRWGPLPQFPPWWSFRAPLGLL